MNVTGAVVLWLIGHGALTAKPDGTGYWIEAPKTKAVAGLYCTPCGGIVADVHVSYLSPETGLWSVDGEPDYAVMFYPRYDVVHHDVTEFASVVGQTQVR